MNPRLKRIEATLDQLSTQNSAPNNVPIETNANPDPPPAKTRKKVAAAEPKSRVQPFPLPAKTAEPPLPAAVSLAASPADSAKPTAAKGKRQSSKRPASPPETVQPFSAQEHGTGAPPLPKSKPPSFSSHRHATNPNLAMGLLKEIESIVAQWQQELEQVVRQIQSLYQEGPIVDGWLESHTYEPQLAFQSVGTATLRHAEIEHLMEYVEQICRVQPPPGESQDEELCRAGYRLCGLDADGQLWSRPCPPQQVPYVSLAIARYQKLRILLGKKQALETRLHHLVQTLTLLHGQLQDPL